MATTSSEEVLLVVNNVRQKKRDGSLYLMAERIGWMESGREMFSISHLYADIKMQKISPEGKSKVQLQLILHDGSANTFHFAHPDSQAKALQDRNDVKELLQQLLPRFKSKANKELEEKNRMLQEDPELFQLYKDLVMSGVISADEFWSNRTSNQTSSQKAQQDVGVSAAFLADIKPQTDGCNGLKYNLTADIIESIFRTYPAVKKKHAENVPDQISESEFWTRFFQSHYFHRDRINAGTKDLFTDCAKSDEKEMKKTLTKQIQDPLLDLTGMDDKSLDEGYGVGLGDKVSTNVSNSNLIKRFNLHNTRVLSASQKIGANIQLSNSENKPGTNLSITANQNSTANNVQNGGSSNASISTSSSSSSSSGSSSSTKTQGEEVQLKRKRIKESIEYEDLASKKAPETVSLNLDKTDRYHHGPMPVRAMNYATSDEMLHAIHSVREDMVDARPTLIQAIHPGTAAGVVSELSPGGALMHSQSHQAVHLLYSQEVQAELKNLYSALCELLRHFWSCFPVASKFLEEKVMRMKTNLERFQAAKLNPFKEKLVSQHMNVSVVNHMEELLETANGKFTSWQVKRSGVR
ncbi:general transcription factor IIH subunit 1-like [Ptychodera flava]|uniref:general transcription factor IIH subunit 1-like n=1 Tax=Ptychodera flava TaxID=63121 RepID=UPI00396A2FDE